MEHISCHDCVHWEFKPSRRYWGICRLMSGDDGSKSLVVVQCDAGIHERCNDSNPPIETHANFSCAKYKHSEIKPPALGVVKGRVA